MTTTKFSQETDLKIERVVDVTPEQLWKAWTTPDLLMPWFCPKPWKVSECRIELFAGGEFFTVMEGPEGERFENSGCYLEIVPNEKLVWTSCLKPGFRPSDSTSPFDFTCILTFEKEGNETRYKAVAMHRNEEGKNQHAQMGFEQGWNICLDQLVAFIKERNVL